MAGLLRWLRWRCAAALTAGGPDRIDTLRTRDSIVHHEDCPINLFGRQIGSILQQVAVSTRREFVRSNARETHRRALATSRSRAAARGKGHMRHTRL